MGLISFFWKRLRSLLGSLLFLALLLALFVAYRVATFGQEDDSARLANKTAYLDAIHKSEAAGLAGPNIVFILYDDMGYADIGAGAVGSDMIKTPNIDRLAREGVMLSDFHSPAPVCTPSRAGFLTGRLAPRAGLPDVVYPTGSPTEFIASIIMNPKANVRLPSEEITLPDVLRAAGYATGMVGKWHLGDRSPSLPNDMGFDSFFGALYSNDMAPFALYRDTTIAMDPPVDQRYLNETYTKEAVGFIQKHANDRFFLYFAHNFPHDPLSVRQERSGKSDAGLFGDVLEELDDSVGEIIATLERTGNLENTLIIISSDNGPWFLGDAGNHRGRKGNTFEGGMRVPFIAYWPGVITGGRTEPAMAMGTDLLPTILDVLDLPAPSDRVMDGRSILDVLTRGAVSPHEYLYYYDGKRLFAVRDQRFKYRGPAPVFYSTDNWPMGIPVGQKEWLFDLQQDPRESYDTSDRYPEELQRLRSAFQSKVREMEVNTRGWE
ncbi:MAG: sulfatase [Gammaproteobacteria bacterium]|jgi:arylsulfatase A-like enzyme|nr:sulfatase [Gammaproteobacteria bacterium]